MPVTYAVIGWIKRREPGYDTRALEEANAR